MSESRALTAEEMRNAMFDHMAGILRYWRDLPAEQLHHGAMGQTELHARMEGFLFSLLVMFDGGSAALPAFDISPAPCQTIDNDDDWQAGIVINDTQMHEIFPWEKCRL